MRCWGTSQLHNQVIYQAHNSNAPQQLATISGSKLCKPYIYINMVMAFFKKKAVTTYNNVSYEINSFQKGLGQRYLEDCHHHM